MGPFYVNEKGTAGLGGRSGSRRGDGGRGWGQTAQPTLPAAPPAPASPRHRLPALACLPPRLRPIPSPGHPPPPQHKQKRAGGGARFTSRLPEGLRGGCSGKQCPLYTSEGGFLKSGLLRPTGLRRRPPPVSRAASVGPRGSRPPSLPGRMRLSPGSPDPPQRPGPGVLPSVLPTAGVGVRGLVKRHRVGAFRGFLRAQPLGREASASFRGRRAVGLGDEELPPILSFFF